MSAGGVPKDKSVEKVIWLEDIYNYLYTQKGNDPPPAIYIPNTVMLKYQRPCAWFSSSDEGEIMKRADTKELDLHQIKKTFCDNAKHDCVAYYVSYSKSPKGNRSSKIEYFDEEGLENFLFNRAKENNGIVQKFEKPLGTYNNLIRAYWTPHKLLLQQRVNKNMLRNKRVPMNERLATFDGPEHLNNEFDIKSYKLKSRLEAHVGGIVAHVRKLLPYAYALWSFECFFKLCDPAEADAGGASNVGPRPPFSAAKSGPTRLLFLWCNDLRVFNTGDPPKLEAFLTPPIEPVLAPQHKYERAELRREFFRCPCAGFNIDAACDRAGGLFDVKQMKLASYRYMILYHQQQAPIERDVCIPEDSDYSKLSAYRRRWIEDDEMVKFKENTEVKAVELRSGSLAYNQMHKGKGEAGKELTGWEQIPPLPVTSADPLVFKFLSKLAIVDGRVVQAHNLSEYSRQDVQDFRRWYLNVVLQEPGFLDKKMKVCDACCIKFNSSADDNMSLEMTKLVVGPPGGGSPPSPGGGGGRVRRRRSKAASASAEAMGRYMTASPLLLKSFRSAAAAGEGMLPPIGAARSLRLAAAPPPRAHTSLGAADADAESGAAAPRPSSSLGAGRAAGAAAVAERSASSIGGAAAALEGSTSSLASAFSAARRRLPAKDVREWIRFFYAEAELRESAAAVARSRGPGVSPYMQPLPFRTGPS